MEVVLDLNNYNVQWDSSIITMGDFDGFHLGHQKIIKKAIQIGRQKRMKTILLTYEPSPKKVLMKLKEESTIYTQSEKIAILQKFPIDILVFYPFQKKTSKITANDFLKKILIQKLKLRYLIIGYDHKFGYKQKGNIHYLQLASKKYGFQVHQVKPKKILGSTISSSIIRKNIHDGNITLVNKKLGYPYLIIGLVIQGKNRGHSLGFPTANILVDKEKIIPKNGVYFCLISITGNILKGVVNIGEIPTFHNKTRSIEVHIIGFNQNIYGETIKIYLIDRFRDEKKFFSKEELIRQIEKDVSKANEKYVSKNLLK